MPAKICWGSINKEAHVVNRALRKFLRCSDMFAIIGLVNPANSFNPTTIQDRF
jgi:hypothetical protein